MYTSYPEYDQKQAKAHDQDINAVIPEAFLDFGLMDRGRGDSPLLRGICPDSTESMFHLCFQSSVPFHTPLNLQAQRGGKGEGALCWQAAAP